MEVQWGSCFEVLAEDVTWRTGQLVRRTNSHPSHGYQAWNFEVRGIFELVVNSGVEKEQKMGMGEMWNPRKEGGRWREPEESSFCIYRGEGVLKLCSRNWHIQIGGNSFLGPLLFGSLRAGSRQAASINNSIWFRLRIHECKSVCEGVCVSHSVSI